MFHCRIKRISDERYRALRSVAYPIFEQIPAFSYAMRYPDIDETPLNLAEYYALMRLRFGESGLFYDDWKGIFSFPVEVEVFNDKFWENVRSHPGLKTTAMREEKWPEVDEQESIVVSA